MVQTAKQIMNNPNNMWFAMLIFRAMLIPDINKSAVELLNARKFRTNLPMIDFAECKMNEPAVEKLIQNRISACYRQGVTQIRHGYPCTI